MKAYQEEFPEAFPTITAPIRQLAGGIQPPPGQSPVIDPAKHDGNKRDVSEVKPVEQLEMLPTRGEKLKEDAKSVSHMLTHVPKNPYCTTCQRAKMQATSAPNRKGLHSDGSARP